MYNVFIADDENWVIESLRECLRSTFESLNFVGEANDGIDALDKILKIRPDIVFSDIRMPGNSGLELIKKVKEVYPEIQFIIVSGYAEFAYAQKALNYGAVGYCLKPFDDFEIADILKRAIQIIESIYKYLDQDQDAQKAIKAEILINIDLDNEGEIQKNLKKIGFICKENESYLAVSVIGKYQGVFQHASKIISLKLTSYEEVYLFIIDNSNDFKKFLEQENYSNIKGIGIGAPTKDVKGIIQSIRDSEIAAYQYFISETRNLYCYDAVFHGNINPIIKELSKLIESKEIETISDYFQKIEIKFKKEKYNITHALQIYNTAIICLKMQGVEADDDFIYNYQQFTIKFSNLKSMFDFLVNNSRKQIDSSGKAEHEYLESQSYTNKTFGNMISYINDNYNKDISIQSLSSKFFINPSYISQLFKKEIAETFIEYLTKIRLKQACSLLKGTKLSVYEIGEKVGYFDYYYFTKLFKKMIAMTPTQFRELNKEK